MLDTTVLISSSPIPSHPSTWILYETIKSIRWHLPNAPIFVMCDGVRSEQPERKEAYEEYKGYLLGDMLSEKFDDVMVLPFPEFNHQAVMTIRTMFLVKTPLVLYLEQDTPLIDRPIDWDLLSNTLNNGAANHIRLHYDETIHPEHQHLMLPDRFSPYFIKTVQYHNRPFLTKADWFGQFLIHYFRPDCRTFIEDLAYSPIACSPWDHFRCVVYDPNGNGEKMKRSTHLDGRAGDIKYQLIF